MRSWSLAWARSSWVDPTNNIAQKSRCGNGDNRSGFRGRGCSDGGHFCDGRHLNLRLLFGRGARIVNESEVLLVRWSQHVFVFAISVGVMLLAELVNVSAVFVWFIFCFVANEDSDAAVELGTDLDIDMIDGMSTDTEDNWGNFWGLQRFALHRCWDRLYWLFLPFNRIRLGPAAAFLFRPP